MASSPVTAPSTPVDAPTPDTKAPASDPPPSSPPPQDPPPKAEDPPPESANPPPKPENPPPKSSPPKESSPDPPSPPPPSPPPKKENPTPSPPPPSEKPSSPHPPTPRPPGSSNPNTPPTVFSQPPPPPPVSSKGGGTLSPPHTPSQKSPPSHKAPSDKGSNFATSNQDSGSDNLPLIIGIGAAVGVLILLMLIVCVCCFKKKRKNNKPIQYYADPSRLKGNQYNQNWQGHKVPPPPGGMPPPGVGMGPPGTSGWTPVVPHLSSGEASSYSGNHNSANPQSPSLALGFNKSTFTYDELAAATNGFSQANLLGQGGFGYVHKGVFPNGKPVAVKSLKSGSGQGEREFQAEVDIISRVHHRHLVSLVGYCIAGGQRMLVYEFVPNKTLEYHLHGKGHGVLDWSKRLNIAVGSAKGLAYLHEDCHPRIIHRDIKTANILLDNNFEAMVADFGLAKLSDNNFTHVSTRIMGTFGYLAPEYASSGKLTEKSDVFSFGVMLLELITGRRPVDTTNSYMEDSLVDWARPIAARALEDDDFSEIADPLLENVFNHNEMKSMVACAAASIRHSGKRRPKMSQIVRALEGDVALEDFNEGIRNAQGASGSSSNMSSNISSEYNTRMYNEDLNKFRKMALASQGFESTDCNSVATSTYGLNVSTSSSEPSSTSREMK